MSRISATGMAIERSDDIGVAVLDDPGKPVLDRRLDWTGYRTGNPA